MELSSVFGGDTLKAADLQGTEPTVVIASVEMKKFDNGNKLVIKFQGKKKALVCNKTNANRIAYIHGTNTDGWLGREITLYVDLVDFQGSTVEAIRIRPPARRAPVAQEQNGDFAFRKTSGVTIMEHNGQTKPAERVAGSAATAPDLDDPIPF